MQSMRTLVTPLVVAAILGLGFGMGYAGNAKAAPNACTTACAAEFQECLAEGAYPGFYRCRQYFSACMRACN